MIVADVFPWRSSITIINLLFPNQLWGKTQIVDDQDLSYSQFIEQFTITKKASRIPSTRDR